MTRRFIGSAIAILCLSVSLAHAQRGGERSRGNESRGGSEQREGGRQEPGREGEPKQGGNSAPGGDWSEKSHGGKQSGAQSGNRNEPGHAPAATGYAADQNKNQASGKEGAAAGAAYSNKQQPQATGKEGAATGAAAANKNQPQYSGAQGAAAENRNQPQYSGAQGAAAGAAAANKNQPQYSGAEGAAAGAAAANRNQPQYSGAQGAAAGAAVANNNQPQYSGAQGAAAGAAVANNQQPQYPGAQGAAATSYNQPQYSGAPGAAPGAAAVNPNTPAASGAGGEAAAYAAVRTAFNTSTPYSQAWCDNHPGAWVPAGWVAGAAWNATPWGALAGLCGFSSPTPISYDYGVNVTSQDGNVLVNGQNVGTTSAFSQQAADLATAGAKAEISPSEEWLPVGVFAMVRNEQQHPQFIVQLAINKQGILRGNYTDDISDHSQPIRGAVDKASQRAAWTVGDNKQTVMEAGISDLTGSEAPALIHKNGKTDHWLLIRLTRNN